MPTVAVKELKNRLTHYLRVAQGGEAIVVTSRGRPVAVLKSVAAVPDDATDDEAIARLVRKGVARAPRAPVPKRLKSVRVKGASVADAVIADRADRC